MHSRNLVWAMCLGGVALCSGSRAVAQAIVEIPPLIAGGSMYPSGLSDDGAFVAGDGLVTGGSVRAWRWSPGGTTTNLGVPSGANHSYGYGISGNGQVVIGDAGGSFDTACRWTQATGMVSIGSLATGMPSFAFAASFDGSIIVGDGYLGGGQQRVMRWTSATGAQPFGQLPAGAAHSVGLGVSSNGSVITGYVYNNAPNLYYPHACVWNSAGAVTDLGVLAGSQESVPGAVSGNGLTVVGYCADGSGQSLRAFKWTAGSGMIELAMPSGASQAVASAVTSDGSIVVGYSATATNTVACIWTAAGAQNLDAYFQSRGISTAGWTFSSVTVSANGSSFAGTGTHNGAAVAWYLGAPCSNAPTITGQPQPVSVTEGMPASFTVTATGSGLSYQWSKNLVPIGGATAPTYSITSTAIADAGSYTCLVSTSCGSAVTNPATLTVSPACSTAPTITGHPMGATVAVGSPVSFSVSASGVNLSYQWAWNLNPIGGATGSTFSILSTSAGDAGSYTCTVTNGCGSSVSDPAILTIDQPCSTPVIHDQPASVALCPGQATALSIVAIGATSYQWQRNMIDIPDATQSFYAIDRMSVATNAFYRCIVSSDCGSVVSETAHVEFTCPGDFNCSGTVNSQDLFDFLAAFFAADPTADFTGDGAVNSQDFFDFLTALFDGC